MTNRIVWHLQCFGELRAEGSEKVVERFPTQKTAALLALLALRGPQNRESVCVLLWPDKAPEAARNSLSAALSALRRELGQEVLEADRQRISLVPGIFTTDVGQFDVALKSGDAARAVELYKGHLLPAFHEDPFPALNNEYVEKARAAFSQQLSALEAASEPEALRRLARRASLLFGDDERWFVGQMKAHSLLGDVDAALRTYEALGRHTRKNGEVISDSARSFAKSLRREREAKLASSPAEVAPSPIPTTQELEVEAPPKAIAPANLPPAWTQFFGREAEKELLEKWLSVESGGSLLVTLSGAGGSGKTRLAIETLRAVAADAVPCAAQGVYFVGLAALSDPDLLHGTVRDALGLPVSSNSSPLEQLRRETAGQRFAVLLDNFEQLLPHGAEKLQELRLALPGATFLVTSRVLLNLPGEREFPVTPLPTPLRNSSPKDVGGSPSVALFCDRAGFTVDESNAESVSALCRRLDGIPLALELAAARAKVLSPAQILERLSSHPNFLQSREFGVPARHQTLRATLEWSTQLLTPALHQLFCQLSVFRGGWTLEAAEAVSGDEEDVLEMLTVLRESSLIRIESNREGNRFRMLETLREFGQEQLGEHRTDVERAFFTYFLKLAKQAASAMQGPQQSTWLSRLDIEQDNLRAALEWARENEPAQGLQLATALIDFWETRLSLDEGRHWIETFLRATEDMSRPAQPPQESRSRALSGAGRLAWYANDLTSAEALPAQGLETAKQSGVGADALYAMHSSARSSAMTGDLTRAREMGEESVRLSRAGQNKAFLLASLVDLAPTLIISEEFSELLTVCQEAIALARELGDKHALALALYLRAIGNFYQGDYRPAMPLLNESEALCRQFDARWDLMVCLGVVGSVHRELGNLPESARAFRESLSLARELAIESVVVANILLASAHLLIREGRSLIGARLLGATSSLAETLKYELPPHVRNECLRYEAEARAQIGDVQFGREWQEGRQLRLPQALDLALQDEIRTEDAATMALRSRALSGAGRLAFYGSQATEATALLDQGLEAAHQSGDPSAVVYATRTLARVAALGGDSKRARELGLQGVQLSRESSDSALLLESLIDLAFADFNEADLDSCNRHCEEAIQLARAAHDEHALALSLVTLACVKARQEKYEESLSLLAECEPICRRLGAHWELMVCLSNRGDVLSRQGRFQEAKAQLNEGLSISREHFLNSWNVVTDLLAMGFHFVRSEDFVGGAVVFGAAEALRQKLNYQLMPLLVPDLQSFSAQAQEALGSQKYQIEFQRGQNLTPEEAIDFALNRNMVSANPEELDYLATRSKALSGAGRLASYANDASDAYALLEESLAAARRSGDYPAMVHATRTLSRVVAIGGETERANELGRESVRLARESGDTSLLIESLMDLAFANYNICDYASAGSNGREALELAAKIHDDGARCYALLLTAAVCDAVGRLDEALVWNEECRELCERLGVQWDLLISNALHGQILSKKGEHQQSQSYYHKSLEICRDTNITTWHVVTTFLSLSCAWLRQGEARNAAILLGAMEALRQEIDYTIMPALVPQRVNAESQARDELGAATYEALWNRGFAMTTQEAMDFALEVTEAGQSGFDATESDESMATRARALSGAGRLAWHHSDYASSRELVMQGLETARQSGDLSSFVYAVAAFVRFTATSGDIEGDMALSRALAQEAVTRSRASQDASLLLESLIALCYASVTIQVFNGMRAVHREAVAIARELRDENRLAVTLISFAMLAYCEGNHAESVAYLEESLPICQRLQSTFLEFSAHWGLSNNARETGDLVLAQHHLLETLEICRDNPAFRWNVGNGFCIGAYLMVVQGEMKRAAQLMGAAEETFEKVGYKMVPVLSVDFNRFRALAIASLGERSFNEFWELGKSLTVDGAIALVTEGPSIGSVSAEPDDISSLRSRALSGAGQLAWHDSDLEASRQLVHQGLEEARRSGDTASFVFATAAFVRFAMVTGDIEGYMSEARRLSEEAVARSQQVGDQVLMLESLLALGYSHTIVGNLSTASEVTDRGTDLARELGDESNLSRILNLRASIYYHQRDFTPARAILEESAIISHSLGSTWDLIVAKWTLSSVAREQGDLALAKTNIVEALNLCRANPSFRWGMATVLQTVSYLLFALGKPEQSARLCGASEALEEETHYKQVPILRVDYERFKQAALDALGAETFEKAWENGRMMSLDEALQFALTIND